MYRIIIWLFMCLIFLSLCPVNGQDYEKTHQFHSWFYYVGDHKISEKWGIHPEIQFRRTGLGTNPQEFVIRSAVNYYPNDWMVISLGYVYARQFPYGVFPIDFEFPEHRAYEQVELLQNLNKLDITHRFRLEQRWIAEIVGVPDPDSQGGIRPDKQGWPFQNRFRYNLGFTLPFKGEEIDNREYYLFASNEAFFSFGKNVNRNWINQNRAQVGIGYQAGSFGRVEIGYLYQYIRSPDWEQVENNHTLTISWISKFNFY